MITNILETGSSRCVTVPATVQLPAVQTALCAGPSIKQQAALRHWASAQREASAKSQQLVT